MNELLPDNGPNMSADALPFETVIFQSRKCAGLQQNESGNTPVKPSVVIVPVAVKEPAETSKLKVVSALADVKPRMTRATTIPHATISDNFVFIAYPPTPAAALTRLSNASSRRLVCCCH